MTIWTLSLITVRQYRHMLVALVCSAFLLTALVPTTGAAGPKKIAIISIDEEPNTLRTIKGVKASITRYGLEPAYNEVIFTGNPDIDNDAIATLRSFNPDIIVTVGSYATARASQEFPNKPIVFATVINPQSSGFVAALDRPGGNITGAALDIPPDIQFKYFAQVVGDIKKMGVLYSKETENIIRQATIAARQLGIELIAYKIKSEREIPGAIDSLCQSTQALWSVADQTIYTPHSTQYIILQTLRHGIPLMGFSQSLVEAGGLFTLDFDFKDIGRQAGEIAVRVLSGSDPGAISVTTPGVIYFKYNANTANQIEVHIPEELLAIAKEVVE